MPADQEIVILPFQPEDQNEVRKLILAGLEEHWGTLDLTKNPDLNDIQTTYAKAVFLVARRNGKIVGTGALIPRSKEIAEIVRMSVSVDMRRHGIGRKILQELYQQAKSLGLQKIILETTETWNDAVEFYKKFGFGITHYLDGDVYFALDVQ